MIEATTFKGQTVAVFGLGRSGISTVLSLKAGGAKVLAWDDNPKARKAAKAQDVPIKDLRKTDWSKIEYLALSPGVPDTLPEPHWTAAKAKEHNIPIICDIEIFACEVAARAEDNRPVVIAITGTNGKSTTTAMIGHILDECGRDAQIGGNIGRGVLDLDPMHRGSFYVLELSSYQLERTYSLRANAAIFLNLSPDHLERHGDMESYRSAKARIFNNQIQQDAAIVGVDDDYGRSLCSMLKRKNGRQIIPISSKKTLAPGVSAKNGILYCRAGRQGKQILDLKYAKALEGIHNWQNAAAAYAAIASLGLKTKEIGNAILSFPGLAHRMETVGQVGPVRFVNDSKATNADAALQALQSYENIFWIAGGKDKSDGIAPLSPFFPRIKKAYLIGEAAPRFMRTLSKHDVDHKVSGNLSNAIICATRDAMNSGLKSSIVLLSPACSSWDQFADFEARGDQFREIVQEIVDMFEREKSPPPHSTPPSSDPSATKPSASKSKTQSKPQAQSQSQSQASRSHTMPLKDNAA